MRIAIDTSALKTEHAVRGVGFYLKNLLNSIHRYHPEIEIIEVENYSELPKNLDLIHLPFFDLFSTTLPEKFEYKTVVTIHDLTPLIFPKLFPSGIRGHINFYNQKRRIIRADSIITDSTHSKKDIHAILKIPNEKINAVYLSVSEEFRKLDVNENREHDLRKKYSLPEKFVFYVGDATPNKNLPVLLEAIKIAKVPLVIAGKVFKNEVLDKSNRWNKDLLFVQNQVKERSDIQLLGFVPTDELVKMYNIASVFVMPSFYEGFGLPLLEAMSCQAPVITTKESSLPEVGGDAPIYVEYKNPDEFSDAILKVVDNETLRIEMGKKSAIQAGKFSLKQTADQTVDVYRKVITK